MTLNDALKKYNNRDFKCIEYRTNTPPGSSEKDMLAGMAAYKNKMLVSLDGDTYHLSDEIDRYELFQDDWLVVWYESEWIR